MLRLLRTPPVRRLRHLFALESLGGRRSYRPMAVPMRPVTLPMAVPMERPEPSRASQLMAIGALALATAGLWRQESVVSATRVALDGLRVDQALAVDVDAADIPAMRPELARLVDPHTRSDSRVALRTRQVAVQPFVYQVREGETLQEIAARFGTDVSALLWNNGLESADKLEAGARLTVLPVQGVLHLVKAGETLATISERYGSRPGDLVIANALDPAGTISPGQVIVVAGGRAPTAVAQAQPNDPDVHLQSSEIIGELGPAGLVVASAVESRDESLPEPSGASGWQREFILSIAPGARASQRKSGVPASVTLAQAILESDWGRSALSREANNLFGIKAFNGAGSAGVYQVNTWEVYGSQNVTIFSAFRAYASVADSIADHGNWFQANSRYRPALDVKDDPRAFAYAISAAGYATDPAYAPKLIGLMDRFNLYAYDVAPDE